MKIIVTKSGTSLQTRASGHKNARGEMYGTEDMVRHLAYDLGHDVVYFGKLTGELPCVVVEPHTAGLTTFCTHDEQQQRFDLDQIDLMRALTSVGSREDPVLWIESCGMPASCSFVKNPRGLTPQLSSLRYSAPMLGMMDRLRIPRVCFVADVRSYPRDAEMSDGWPHLRPAALLDNVAKDVSTQIAYQHYLRRSIDCKSYSWADLDWGTWQPLAERGTSLGVVSHCHVSTGFRKKRRREAWHTLLGEHGELMQRLNDDWWFYGEGWDAMPELGLDRNPELVGGVTDLGGVDELLGDSVCSPVVAPDEGFVTNKAYIIASHGCLPALATGCPHAWDPEGLVVPLGHPTRCRSWTDTLRLCEVDESMRLSLLAELHSFMRPDWSVLDALVKDYGDGMLGSEEWFTRYGGYRACAKE